MSSLYIHIPFCHHKCIYCGFYSIAQSFDKDLYVDCLIKELSLRNSDIDKSIETIYFGGGTPSLLEINQLERIIKAIHNLFTIIPNAEITLEANPENCSKEYLNGLKQLGFNRLSIGIESFDDKELKILNRSHTSSQATQAIKNAKMVGFKNISIDLISNLMNSTLESWKANLETFLSYDLQHISCYTLMIEKNTMLEQLIKKHKYYPIDEDLSIQQFDLTMDLLKKNSFLHYETSSYAKEGFQSQHNMAYWTFKDYLGIGAAAHSYYKGQRIWNEDNVKLYVNRINDSCTNTYYQKEILTPIDNYNEYIMLSLRMQRGLQPAFVKENFPSYYNTFLKKLQTLIKDGFLNKDLSLTNKGWHLQDKLIIYMAQ